MTIGVVTGYVTSLSVVGRDIAEALRRSGYPCKLFTRKLQYYDAVKEFDQAILFFPYDPIYVGTWLLVYRDYVKNGINTIGYVTVEGKPKPHLIQPWFRKDFRLVAVSNFVKDMLAEVGITVMDVIPHGIDINKVKEVSRMAKGMKEEIKSELGVEVLYGTICSDHRRKGLDRLRDALQIATEELPEAGFYILTKPKGASLIGKLKHVKVDTNYGMLEREEVLTLMGSFDFYLCSSLAEGFCLPLIEANAFGIPAIYPEYPPLTEVAPPELNFPFPILYIRYMDFRDGILYRCGIYKPKDMVSTIKNTFELYTSNHESYKKLGDELKSHAEKYDLMKTYPKLVKYLAS